MLFKRPLAHRRGYYLKHAAIPRLAPHGLDPIDRSRAACSLSETPLGSDPRLSRSARFAVDVARALIACEGRRSRGCDGRQSR